MNCEFAIHLEALCLFVESTQQSVSYFFINNIYTTSDVYIRRFSL